MAGPFGPRSTFGCCFRSAALLAVGLTAVNSAFTGDCADPTLCAETSGYIVTLDAGSTGTRAHVFFYERRRLEPKRFPYILAAPMMTLPDRLATFKMHPGISAFVNDTEGLARSLRPLLSAAKDALLLHKPDLELKRVPLYLGATAGMRTLSDESRDTVMRAVRKFLRSQENPFSFLRDEQARVLAGEEEGAFAWLALNQDKGVVSPDPDETFGSLDFGGGSMQIAFVPSETSILANIFPMHFGGAVKGPIHLYSHSFLEFGHTDSFQRATRSLPLLSAGSKLEHPCMPTGLTWQVEPTEFGVSTSDPNPTRVGGKLEMHGSGDAVRCYEIARKLIEEAPCHQKPCSMLGVYQPHLNRSRFVLFSEDDDLKAWQITPLLSKGVPLLAAIRRQLPRICALPLETQVELFGASGLTGAGPPPCWRATWILTVLGDGLKFPDDGQHITTIPGCCDYSLGQATYEVNFYPFRVERSSYASFLSEISVKMPEQDPSLLALAAVAGAMSTLAMLSLMVVARSALWQTRAIRRRLHLQDSDLSNRLDGRLPLLSA